MRLVAGVLALALFAPFVRAEDTDTPQPQPSAPSAPDATDDTGIDFRSAYPREAGNKDRKHLERREPPGASPGKVPLRVVRVMPESRQALLFDRKRATHVLAEVGATLDGYTVEDIDGDEVTLRFEGTRIVLAAPARGQGRRRAERGDVARSPEAARPVETKTDPAPVDPYGEPAIRTVQAPDAPVNDSGAQAPAVSAIAPGEGGVRVATAPGVSSTSPDAASETASTPQISAGESGVRVMTAPDAGARAPAAAPAEPFPVDAYADSEVRVATAPDAGVGASAADPATPGPFPVDAYADSEARVGGAAPAAAPGEPGPFPIDAYADGATASAAPPAATSPASPAPGSARAASGTAGLAMPSSVQLSRAEVDGALADFAKLATAIRCKFSAAGLVINEVSEGSIFARAGLRAGDVVVAINGAPLRSLDDAANLYARASAARAITAQVMRAGKQVTLRVTIGL
jgi:hypothetical protein